MPGRDGREQGDRAGRRPGVGLLGVALGLALLLCGRPTATQDLPAAAVLGRLQAWLDGTKTLEARFEQTLVSGALGGGLAERGRVYVERPGRLRFDYAEPERKVAIVVDDRTWLYLEGERQLLLGRLQAEADLLPALLAGSKPLEGFFDATFDRDGRPPSGGPFRLALRPRVAGGGLERIVVTLRPPTFALESAEVLDAAGNRMDYTFSGMHRNARLPRGAFVFEPPPGTEIRGSHEPEPPAGS